MLFTSSVCPPTIDIDVNFLFQVPGDILTGHMPFPKRHSTTIQGQKISFPVSDLKLNNRGTQFDVAFFLGSRASDTAIKVFSGDCYASGFVPVNQSQTLRLTIQQSGNVPEHITLYVAKTGVGHFRSREEVESFFAHTSNIPSLKAVQLEVKTWPCELLSRYYLTPNPCAGQQRRRQSPHADLEPRECSSGDGTYALNPFAFA